ncbi:DUF1246 domain-containing protein, partial [Candidatus Bipolaricaulota bacterium]|nr:DUF1246 domain-containing protein [Candidatus Bipolaricaulota bacterium]
MSNTRPEEAPTVATICSHSALQIFHGARAEGLETLGIATAEREELYRSFSRAKPDELLIVNSFDQVLDEEIQDELNERNAILVPHGSFVEYVGAERMLTELDVPVFGNKYTLEW